MKHPNAAVDLIDTNDYARAVADAMKLGPKYVEALRLQRESQIASNVVVVARFDDGKRTFWIRDRKSNDLISVQRDEMEALHFETTFNCMTDEEYASTLLDLSMQLECCICHERAIPCKCPPVVQEPV